MHVCCGARGYPVPPRGAAQPGLLPQNEFTDEYKKTIGTDFMSQNLYLDEEGEQVVRLSAADSHTSRRLHPSDHRHRGAALRLATKICGRPHDGARRRGQ